MAFGWVKAIGKGLWRGISWIWSSTSPTHPFIIRMAIREFKKRNPKWVWLINTIEEEYANLRHSSGAILSPKAAPLALTVLVTRLYPSANKKVVMRLAKEYVAIVAPALPEKKIQKNP